MKRIPELRFPEFENEGEWLYKKLGEIGEPLMCKRILKEQTTSNPKNGVPFYKIGTFGKEPDAYIPIELFDEFKNKYSFPKKGDILISASGTIGRLVVFDGSPSYFQDSNIVWLGNNESEVSNSFLFHCYSTIKWQTSDGGIISRLYNSDLRNIKFYFSKTPHEQQKIASCLSSLDEVIAAHSQKLELLKNHKKGLLQNLFPCPEPVEGRKTNVPKYRFKEFENDGEWVEKNLESLTLKIGDGIHTTPKYDDSGEYYFINGNNLIEGRIIVEEKTKKVSFSEYEVHKKNLTDSTILLSINGTIGNIAFCNNEKVVLGKSACYIIPKNSLNNIFLYYCLQSPKINSYFISELTGSTIKNLSLKSIRETSVNLPSPKEQQKIASCLSSLDALITAQAEKIEQLKLHKKGLMQGLFPKIND